MADISYHHGTRLSESNETPVLVQVAKSAVVGLLGTAPDADPVKFPLNTPVLLKGTPTDAAGIGNTGTLKDAIDDVFDQVGAYTVVIRVEAGADLAATMSNIVGDATEMTGVHALHKSMQMLGIKPRLIAAPGFTSGDGVTANPVVAELVGILEDLGAVAFVDGPDTTDAAAISYRQKINSQRIYVCDPKVLVWDTDGNDYVARPSSARFAGIQARVDKKLGFWHSVSNKPMNGIGGVTRAISYPMGTNYLNEQHVNTVVNMGDGFTTWGNRGATGDDMWAFLAVRRTADFINEAIEKAYMEFVDKPFSAANVKLMIESGNAAMRTFIAEGAILGGKVWLNQDLNEPTELAAGRITLSLDFEPPAPMEDLRFVAHRNIEYYLELTKAVLQAAA